MVLKNPLSTFGISAELVTRKARPGKCLLTLSANECQHWLHGTGAKGPSPRRLRVLAYAYQGRLDFRMAVHRACEDVLRDAILREIRIRQRDDVVVVCARAISKVSPVDGHNVPPSNAATLSTAFSIAVTVNEEVTQDGVGERERLLTSRVAAVGVLRGVLHFLHDGPAFRDFLDRVADFD
jgi:hypothetical protein